jgi:hypothetical protein
MFIMLVLPDAKPILLNFYKFSRDKIRFHQNSALDTANKPPIHLDMPIISIWQTLTPKIPCIFLLNFAVFDIVGKINFSKNKNMNFFLK